LLVDHFLAVIAEREGRECDGFTPAAIRMLQRHDWPGNVRELEGVVYRSMVMAGSSRRLDEDDIDLRSARSAAGTTKPPVSGAGPGAGPARVDVSRPFAEMRAEVLEQFERSYLEGILRRTDGNLSKAARQAEHERKSLWRLLNKYGIDPRRFKSGS
jgi:DNA-binding NtrC family response regulator